MIGSKVLPHLGPRRTRGQYGRRVGHVSLRPVVWYGLEYYWPLYMTRLPVSATVVPSDRGEGPRPCMRMTTVWVVHFIPALFIS
jgi:hypothetical protein